MKIIGLGPEVHQQLKSSVVDVAIGVFDTWPPHIRGTTLYREDMVWVAREGHPIGASADEADLRTWAEWKSAVRDCPDLCRSPYSAATYGNPRDGRRDRR